MAKKIVLNSTNELIAKQFIRCLFSASTFSNIPQTDWLFTMYNDYGQAKRASTAICTELINREFTFIKANLDDEFKVLAEFSLNSPSGRRLRRTDDQLIKYTVWFCQQQGIVWDDSAVTTVEMDEYRKTKFAGALYDGGCFLSTSTTPAAKSTSVPKNTAGNSGTSPAANGVGYKASGPHSQDIPNLIGGANQKNYLNGNVYCVIADKIGKNTPNAYITPLKVSGNGATVQTVSKQAAETVKFNSGNGWTDCMCWFDNYKDAQLFADQCIAKFGNKFTNIHVVKDKVASNGYFRVSTEFGDAWIKAKKLNERLIEEATDIEPEKPYVNSAKGTKIVDVDIYDEWSHRSYS